MADLDRELAALIDKAPMTDTPEEEAARAGDADSGSDQSAAQSDQQHQQDEPADKAQGAADPQQKAEQKAEGEKRPDELPLDEIKKRWEDQKQLSKKERELRRAEAAAREAAEQRANQLEANMRQLMAQIQQAQTKAPDPEVDVVGALKYTQAQLLAAQQRQAQEAQQRAAFEQQTQIARTIQTKVEDFEAEFKAEHPDYDQALDFLLDTKEAEFEMAGFSKEMAKDAAGKWAMNAAAAMLKTGKNPAEAGYALAKRMGYAAKLPNPAPAAQPDPAQQQREASAAKLQQIKDGQAAAGKMSGGGSGDAFDGSLKSIVSGNLSGAALDAAMDKFLRSQTRA